MQQYGGDTVKLYESCSSGTLGMCGGCTKTIGGLPEGLDTADSQQLAYGLEI